MPSLADLLSQGGAHAWLFAPTAILLGALHGLEPGHSKTMMAAFIIAIRGTVAQAALLGLSAAFSHTAVVWVVAIGGELLGRTYETGALEPYLQLVSAAVVVAVALWMIWRTRREASDHAHVHDDEAHIVEHDHAHSGGLQIAHEGEDEDAHQRAHAADIARRFGGQRVTTGQIALFGLTAGLIPCPAAITVLILCLQLKRVALGVGLVACFGVGLAVTMVSVGVLASLSLRQVRRRWSGFDAFAARAPYASGALMLMVAAYMAAWGWIGLMAARA